MPMSSTHGRGLYLPYGSIGLFGFGVFVLSVAVAILYLRGQRKLWDEKSRRWPWWRTLSFLVGLGSIDAALVWPISALTMRSFSAHAVQHVLVMVVGPMLLAAGAPTTLLLQGSSRRTKTVLLRILNSRTFRYVHFPPLVWLLYYGSMFVFFLTPLFGIIMDPKAMVRMDLVNVFFLAVALLFWWPVIAVDPIPSWRLSPAARAAALMLGVPLNTFLGLTLTQLTRPISSLYSLGSTRAGADFLWGSGEIFSLLPLVFIYIDWIRDEDRKERRGVLRAAGASVSSVSSGQEDSGSQSRPLDRAWEESWKRYSGGIPSS
ncbi:MAG: cytochrome c oxidase assembly protein [Acidimicrobiales bacterium]